MKVVPCILGDDWKTTIRLKKKDSKKWYWGIFHIPMTRKNKERYGRRIKALDNAQVRFSKKRDDGTETSILIRWEIEYAKFKKEVRR